MAVSWHRNSVTSTADDLERAAGRLETASKTSNDETWSIAAHGGACALYALAWHDLKTEDDMFNVWSMLMTSGIAAESEE